MCGTPRICPISCIMSVVRSTSSRSFETKIVLPLDDAQAIAFGPQAFSSATRLIVGTVMPVASHRFDARLAACLHDCQTASFPRFDVGGPSIAILSGFFSLCFRHTPPAITQVTIEKTRIATSNAPVRFRLPSRSRSFAAQYSAMWPYLKVFKVFYFPNQSGLDSCSPLKATPLVGTSTLRAHSSHAIRDAGARLFRAGR